MKTSNRIYLCAVLCLTMALPRGSAQQICGPQWLENQPGFDGTVWTMTTWDPDGDGPLPRLLVVGGSFSHVGGVPAQRIAAFDGTSWSALGTGLNDLPLALTVFEGDLVAAGRFTTAGDTPVSNIARWDGTQWRPLGSGLPSLVYALAVYQGDLYAGGSFVHLQNTQGVGRWDGSDWVPVGGGTGVYNCPVNWCGSAVYALTVYHDELIVGGGFTKAGSIPANNLARWNGTQWHSLGGGVDNQVTALTVHNDLLIAGGHFQRVGSGYAEARRIASWNGAFWSPLGTGMNNPVYALAAGNGRLFAGGWFTTAGGTPANNVAMWDGGAWSALAGGVDSTVQDLTLFEGDVVAAGDFVTAGGVASEHWARWRDVPPPQIVTPPEALTVPFTENVQFSVVASGVGTLQYAWRRYGVPLVDGGRISGAATAVLTITGATPADQGSYDVVVTDACHSSASPPAYLTVLCPTSISSQPAAQTLPARGEARLSVGASGAGTLHYVWRRNGVPLVDDGRISGAQTAELTISPLVLTDTGDYSVVITDDCRSLTSAMARLTVICPNATSADLDRDCDVDAGDLVIFQNCAAGPAMAPKPGCPVWPNNRKRAIADLDGDSDVDMNDFGVLQRCYAGTDNTPPPGCSQ